MNDIPKKALLLAAGEGTRLRPLTESMPKCLVPIAGRPLLGIWLEQLANSGFEKILVNTHYRASDVEQFINKSPWQNLVELIYEKELLGTFGTLKANARALRNGPFFLAHADNLSFFNMSNFLKAHCERPQETILTMMTFLTSTPSTCGIVELDANGVVQKFHEKVKNPPSNLANGAVFIAQPEIFELVDQIEVDRGEISLEILPRLVGRMFTFHNDTYHRDIGSMESYRKANDDVRLIQKS